MKRIISLFFCLILVFISLTSCRANPPIDFFAEDIEKIVVYTSPRNQDYERTISENEEISRIINHINSMYLTDFLINNPNDTTGMAIIVAFYRKDGSVINAIVNCNDCIKIGENDWLEMTNDEAQKLKNFLLPQIP